MSAQATTPEQAIAQGYLPWSVTGKSRFVAFSSAGVPTGHVTEVYRRGEEMLAFDVPMTEAERVALLDEPLRRPDGSVRKTTYGEYLATLQD